MSESVEQARRALFEAWAAEESEIRQYGSTIGLMRDEHHDRYSMISTQTAWIAFNAALDAVLIALPGRDAKGSGSPDSEMGASLEQYEAVAYNFALDDCRAAIESTGLGIKIK